MRVLITGASGFIGSSLKAFLVKQGIDVVTVKHKALGEGFFGIGNIIKEAAPNVIFHLAGIYHSAYLSDMIGANCLFAAKLLDAVSAYGMNCRVVLMGSAAEYGRVEESALPIREDQPARPKTWYGISKLSQTMMGMSFAEEGMDVVVARPFNVLGVGMSPALAIAGFAHQLCDIKLGKTSAILKTGNLDTHRDFISVDACVKALWLIGTTKAAAGKIVNICCGKPLSIKGIVDRMITLSGLSVSIEVDAQRVRRNDPSVNFGNPSLLMSMTGYLPVMTDMEMDEILKGLLSIQNN